VRARGKAWAVGEAEPSAWMLERIDPIPNRPQSRISSRADHLGSVKGVLYPNGSPGSRIEILVQFRPVDMRGDDLPMKVDLRVSAFAEQEP